MTLVPALAAFAAAALLLSITPGLDTAMVVRTAAAEGPRRAVLATLGIGLGCLVWGLAAALGLGLLLAASHLAYTVLKWVGAAYLVYLGLGLLLRPRDRVEFADGGTGPRPRNWFLRGFLTNILNPKVGVFYLSFLPQFSPAGVSPPPFILLLAFIHALIGTAWLCVLIAAMRPLKRWLERPAVVRVLDRVTGLVFIGFGLRLVLDRR
jgi:threonine/homoserine/homoserine lactone efflux protein